MDSTLCLLTARDRDLFQALERTPLTVAQILKLSSTFSYPFTTERRVQERLQRVCAAGRVRRWRYATAGQGALSYFTLSPLGFRLLHNLEEAPQGRLSVCRPVGVARQAHTRALAEVIVHLLVAAQESSIPVVDFHRENTLRLTVGDEHLYPDTALALQPPAQQEGEETLTYFIELDNCTESVRTSGMLDSWQRKVQFYERYQDTQKERFRVLAFTTGGTQRLRNMLQCAGEQARNPDRSLVYGIGVRDFLSAAQALTAPSFLDHRERSVSLLPRVVSKAIDQVQDDASVRRLPVLA